MVFSRQFFMNAALVALFAFLGGFAAQALLGTSPASAQYEQAVQSFFALSDDKNKKGINAYVADGQPGQVFYGENGQMRIQMGTYSGAGERGMPLMALSDSKGRIRLLFRLFGDNETPVMIMKDTSGRDRLVMGLSLNNPTQEPFLAITDKDGKGSDVFGQYFNK